MGTRRRFQGQVAVVTGAAIGIGLATAKRLSGEGAAVALLDLDGEKVKAAAAEIAATGARTIGLRCDVTSAEECELAVAGVQETLGNVSVLINNAGITHRSPFRATETLVMRRVMDVNVFGCIHMTRAALCDLTARRGRIAVMSSVAGFAPLVGRTGYAASKHAVEGLFSSLRMELSGAGVSATLIRPAFTDTGMAGRALGGDGALSKKRWGTVGRAMTPDKVARAIVDGIWRRRRTVTVGWVALASLWMWRLAPGFYERLMLRSQRHELE